MLNVRFPEAIIFDWDNTLVNSWPAIYAAINHTLLHFGRPIWTLEEVKKNCIRSARDSFPDWFGVHWLEASEVFYDRFMQLQIENLDPYKGAESLLSYLKNESIPAFVVSNKDDQHLQREVRALIWEGYFVAVVGSQRAPHDKPHRSHIDFTLSCGSHIASQAVWFVGDSQADCTCAMNAGCTFIQVGAEETVRSDQPFLRLTGVEELHAALSEDRVKKQ